MVEDNILGNTALHDVCHLHFSAYTYTVLGKEHVEPSITHH